MKQSLALCVMMFFLLSTIFAAVEFDALNDLIDCGTADFLQENQPMTISSWVYTESEGEGGGGAIITRKTASSFCIQWSFSIAPAVDCYSFVVNGSTQLIHRASNSTTPMNTWHHVLVTWDGSTTAANIHIYINGQEVSYQFAQDGAGLFDTNGQATIIGNRNDGSRTWDGQITELAVWQAVLTADEIALLAKSRVKGMPLQIQKSALKAYWPLDEFADGATVSGTNSIRDLSGNGNHGTPSNSPVGRAERVLSYPW